ncbi:MarR family winged helix-turn-helix transcriptional regulator [Roseburia hominis]|uniref:MarR family winged helix-turn-helix transcriptional regulator n=1 Tax=Roseburia hominis TaxID=301301 RepID=UPI003AF500E7
MDDTLHYLIMANQMLVQKALLEQLKDTGLTIGQPKILDYLKNHDGSNQKEIAKACFLEAGSLTTILNKMEEKGLIERRILNGNRRSFHIFLTTVGKEKQQLVDTAFSEIEKKALADIPEEEFEQFMSVYHRIYSNLSGISEKQTENDTYLRKKEHTSNE